MISRLSQRDDLFSLLTVEGGASRTWRYCSNETSVSSPHPSPTASCLSFLVPLRTLSAKSSDFPHFTDEETEVRGGGCTPWHRWGGGQYRAVLASGTPSSVAMRVLLDQQRSWQGLPQGGRAECHSPSTLSWGCPPLPGAHIICVLGTQLQTLTS